MESTTIRKPCFMGEDNGLASVAEFSGKINNQKHNHNNNNNNNNNGYFVDNQNHMMRRRNSLRNISWISTNVSSSSSTTAVYSPRAVRPSDPRFDEFHSPHFLESCSLCHKPLGGNRDIFMYRGDTPFCSEECRQEQIDLDEVKEKNRKLKVLRTKNSSSKSQNYPCRTGTVVGA